MSKSDLGPELVRRGDESSALPTAQAAKALRRQQRRIRALMALTIGLWLLAAVLIPGVLLPLGAKIKHFPDLLTTPVTAEQLADVLHRVLLAMWAIAAITWAISTLAALLAAICTIWLVLAVRRVTLAQIS